MIGSDDDNDDDDDDDGGDVDYDDDDKQLPVQTNIYLYKNCEYNDNENRRLKQVFVLYGFAFQ